MAGCKRYIFLTLCVLWVVAIWIACCSQQAFGSEHRTSSKEAMDYQKIFETQMFVGVSNTASDKKEYLESAAVSDQGYYLLVYSGKESRFYIDIYDNHCQLVNEIAICDSGDIVAAFDADSNIVILPYRRNVFIGLDYFGNYLYAYPAETIPESINKYDGYEPFKKQIDDKTYTFTRTLFQKNFTVISDQEAILGAYSSKTSFISTGVMFVCCVMVVIGLDRIIKRKENHNA